MKLMVKMAKLYSVVQWNCLSISIRKTDYFLLKISFDRLLLHFRRRGFDPTPYSESLASLVSEKTELISMVAASSSTNDNFNILSDVIKSTQKIA